MKNLSINSKISDKCKNIAIIGHMGSGKSLIGKLIAKKLRYKYLDSDELIEKKKKKTINQIFIEEGEIIFRKYEEKLIVNLKLQNNLVLSLGGGSILSKKVRNFLKNKFITVFLDTDLKILEKRLKNSVKRPLLHNVEILKKIKELDIIRRKYYLLANIILNNYETPANTVKKFLIKYNKFNEKEN